MNKKPKQYIINALKYCNYYIHDDYVVVNINSCFSKKDNYMNFLSCLKETRDNYKKLNLCNLASYCYRVGIDYASNETLSFVKRLIEYVKQETDFKITQDNIENCGEIDMQPLHNLVSVDKQNNIIYANCIILDCLKILGYVDSQLYDIIDFSRNLNVIIPPDLKETLPILSKNNSGCYNTIKELLC